MAAMTSAIAPTIHYTFIRLRDQRRIADVHVPISNLLDPDFDPDEDAWFQAEKTARLLGEDVGIYMDYDTPMIDRLGRTSMFNGYHGE
jgi:hypothetical protein